MTTNPQELLAVALTDYDAALQELNRPEHDVVTHTVCHLTREAITSMLRAYLGTKNISFTDADTLEQLVTLSKAQNYQLNKYDFSVLQCGHLAADNNPGNYCLSETRVNSCFRLLDSMKDYLFSEMKMS